MPSTGAEYLRYTLGLSVASAQAYLSAAASGMMALTGVVFAMAFVMVQFSAIAYSPRLVLWFARDRTLFHGLGVFTATFVYALFTLAWIDRLRVGAPALLTTRGDHDGREHASVRPADATPERLADIERLAFDRR